jgi:pyruvate formate lyase activating enzyme
MRIAGLQKVSTIDYPGEICCVVFLHGCNFRCGFCYNPNIVVGESGGSFSEGYILDFLKSRVGKLDGVCISGGEPLMSLDLGFIRKIRERGFKVKVDTNGSFPNRLKEMIDLGLVDYIAMDVKSCVEDYSKVVGVNVNMDAIERSMKMVYDFGEGEFRTTVVGRLHSKDSVVDMGKWMNEVCGGKPGRIFLQGFKSGQEMIDSSFKNEKDVEEEFLLELKESIEGYFGEVGIRV